MIYHAAKLQKTFQSYKKKIQNLSHLLTCQLKKKGYFFTSMTIFVIFRQTKP